MIHKESVVDVVVIFGGAAIECARETKQYVAERLGNLAARGEAWLCDYGNED